MKENVSIIVPVYNVEKYLDRCLSSIINQTYKNLEIILVDDGSTDKSGTICDNLKIKDPRVKVIHKQNEGLGYARNSGLEVATGRYVTFIDGDDYIGETHIEDMKALIEQTETDTCIAGHTKVYADKKIKYKNVCAGNVYKGNVKEEILPRMCGADCKGKDYIEMSVCMVLLSNEIIKKNNLRFVSERDYISEDLVFDFDYYSLSKGVCVSDRTDYYYCDNEGSLTTKYNKDRFANQVKLYNYLATKSKEIGIEDLCVGRLQNTVISIARYSVKLEYKFALENGTKIAIDRVKKICANQTLVKIMNEYDDSALKISSRLVNYLLKKRLYVILRVVMWAKNKYGI